MSDSMDKVIENNLDAFDFKEKNQPEVKYEFTTRTVNEEIKNIRLQPEQIEEINTDDYSLLLFNATRVEPLSLCQIKKFFPEPSSKKAKSVMDRFIDCGLVHITTEGKYYSNYPNYYIDYSLYRYDAILEAKKDAKVFELMKENCDSKTYWEDKSYFSEDGFFTKEQSQEIAKALNEVRLKVKKFTSENRKKKKVADLIFRRFKYYDMILGLFLALSFIMSAAPDKAQAQGNDPGTVQINQVLNREGVGFQKFWDRYNIRPLSTEEVVDQLIDRRSIELISGNDPGANIFFQEAFLNRRINNFEFRANNFYQAQNVVPVDVIIPDAGGHDPGKPQINGSDQLDPTQRAIECGEELEEADGSLLGISQVCKLAIFHASLKECDESLDKSFCENVKISSELINFF